MNFKLKLTNLNSKKEVRFSGMSEKEIESRVKQTEINVYVFKSLISSFFIASVYGRSSMLSIIFEESYTGRFSP